MAMTPRLRKLLKEATATPEGRVAVEDMLAMFVADVDGAEKFYRKFHWGNEPRDLTPMLAPTVAEGDVLVQLGPLVDLTYEATKGTEFAHWNHEFSSPRPILAWTPAGKLVIAGGGYRVTRAGIVG